jgi:putative endonuclease
VVDRMFYVYILENSEGKHYIGHTEELAQRLKRHNGNKVPSTKNKGPWKIVYNEQYKSRNEAYARERQIKRYKSGEAFRKLLMS